jgi:hypothetical protein
MRTGSFHRTISPARHLAMPARLPAPATHPSSGSMDNARGYQVVKSPDLTASFRATFSGHQE